MVFKIKHILYLVSGFSSPPPPTHPTPRQKKILAVPMHYLTLEIWHVAAESWYLSTRLYNTTYQTTISFVVASIKTYNRSMFLALPSSGILRLVFW